jgi:hypothetical protein
MISVAGPSAASSTLSIQAVEMGITGDGALHVFLRYNVISATQLHEAVGEVTSIKGDKVAQQRKNDEKRSRPSP